MTIHAAVSDYLSPLDAWLGRLNRRYEMLPKIQRVKVDRILGKRKPERTEAYALALAAAIREAKEHSRSVYVPLSELQFPWLSDRLQDAQMQALYYGLTISHYNSGSPHNQHNGTRIFYVPPDGDYVDFFRGDHLTHCRDLREVYAFLDGYRAALRKDTGKWRVRVSENQSSHDPYMFDGTFQAATEDEARKAALDAAQDEWGWSDEQRRDMMFVAAIVQL